MAMARHPALALGGPVRRLAQLGNRAHLGHLAFSGRHPALSVAPVPWP
jgi:hypothetical protein